MSRQIILNDGERRIAKYLGEIRRQIDLQENVTERNPTDRDGLEIMIEGFSAEFAVARYLNVYPDLSINPRRGGPDLISRQGKLIDVKLSRKDEGKLIVKLNKRISDADIYILVVGNPPVFKIVGWAYASEIIRPENIEENRFGKAYMLDQNKLHPINGRYR